MVARGAATKPNSKPATTSLTPDDSLRILNEQRSVRPSSPHFTIYQPQLTWLGSIANRITGTGLSVGMYAYAIAYFGALHTGYGELVSSGYLTSLVASFPFWLKLSLKAPIAAAFNFHTWNGIRHLAWDMGYFISVKGCYQSGYAVLGVTALGTVGLCML
ncbi:cytochrome b560 subunit of succinate dehydrogenase [Jaminaea rosea]|uniref:Cytochrome b560 subunit of succinate dehydrogenase n=1 Tax=Jaminaea rosea TaxID=1569628 RepID=A0A316US08_9BASI|nr:cytochrome b560 subunit of succinate dehydrogenase [Jaminaea rosea]PWN28067.1 cytochrome b560 subunit of succinate dehydrogenase [Jaminaea rosea]